MPKLRSIRRLGFTLIELLVVVTIIAILMILGSALYTFAIDKSNNSQALADVAEIGAAVIKFQVENSALPNSLAQVDYGGASDPWGNAYQYLPIQGRQSRGQVRKDRNLVPINTLFDLYSMGKDGRSVSPLTAKASHDDIIWANDGAFVGVAEDY